MGNRTFSLTITVFLVFFVVASTPLINGYIFKQQFMNVLSGISTVSNDQSSQIIVQEYQRGWLHSTIKLRLIAQHKNSYSMRNDSIDIDIGVTHGPFVYDELKRTYVFALAKMAVSYGLPKQTADALALNLNGRPLVLGQVVISYGNEWRYSFKVEPISVAGMGSLTFGGLSGVSHYDVQGGRLVAIDSTSEIGSINVTSQTAMIPVSVISIMPTKYKLSAHRLGDAIWEKSLTMSLPSFVVKFTDGRSFSITDLMTYSVSGMNEQQLFDGAMELSAAKIEYVGAFIPNLYNSKFKIQIDNLNPTALERYWKMERSREWYAQASDILTNKTKLNAELSFDSSFGKLSFNGESRFNPSAKIDTRSYDSISAAYQGQYQLKIDPALLNVMVTKIIEMTRDILPSSAPVSPQSTLAGSAAMPPVVTQPMAPLPAESANTQAAALIDQWLAQGYLINEGGQYRTVVVVDGGVVKVNGKDMDLNKTGLLQPALRAN